MAARSSRRALLVGAALVAAGLALAAALFVLAQWPLPLATSGGVDDVFVAQILDMDTETVEIAALADTHAEHAELRELAKDMLRALRDDHERMGSRRAAMLLGALHPASRRGADRAAVAAAPVFDKAFIEVMMSRYERGIEWCRRAMRSARDGRVRMLASQLIASRARELVLMRLYYETWYGTSSGP
jgi:uncharacterized protein (DUF305 family)